MNKLVFILPLTFFSFLLAVWSGWLRMGWVLPDPGTAAYHGALMVNSFLASVIFLERAVVFKNLIVLLVPFINALSVIFFVMHQPMAAAICYLAGSLCFVAITAWFCIQHKELHYFIFLTAALNLLAGNAVLFVSGDYPGAVHFWMAFFLLTIVAERLELSRFLELTTFRKYALLSALFITQLFLLWNPASGGKIFLAIGFSAVALWLLRFDMARQAIRVKGAPRYSGILLLVGYTWLIATAALLFLPPAFSWRYDAILHSFFIGFVMSMIFSHAPIILPAITRVPVKIYRPFLYAWFVILQLSLLIRICGDLEELIILRQWGGMINGIVIMLFFLSVAGIFLTEKKRLRLRKAKASVVRSVRF